MSKTYTMVYKTLNPPPPKSQSMDYPEDYPSGLTIEYTIMVDT